MYKGINSLWYCPWRSLACYQKSLLSSWVLLGINLISMFPCDFESIHWLLVPCVLWLCNCVALLGINSLDWKSILWLFWFPYSSFLWLLCSIALLGISSLAQESTLWFLCDYCCCLYHVITVQAFMRIISMWWEDFGHACM